ncbi:lipid-A-disaccharide synthase [Paralimibaculum aggregatum]|uniref:Lipid-A-disaccharide synthase n=1 Tax=Paralimibaculum aggregatum TaxID=3036245 RepID=A0ABQ6LMX5_9RHOB|nr:lipid-A-disaccharide synthase [Limibaculum sp. NKW23]GMG83664.1 lipid-A-disaccharide synthase [Limibaculum sp. NKW23]
MSGPLIYLVAGEPSGDRLGAGLIRALRAARPDAEFAGVGGLQMQAAGLRSLFEMSDLTVMGIAEVVPRLPTILRRMRQTTADVLARRPAALVTIDAPSFGLRVAERVRRAAPGIRTVHYVAPSVWAWRPGRAKHMARFTDQVLALLPFEPPYMAAAGMECDFVGHPLADLPPVPPESLAAFRAARGIAPETPLLVLAPGSRRGEVGKLMPVFGEAAARLAAERPGLEAVVPVAETVAASVTGWAASLPMRAHPVLPDAGEAAKRAGLASGAAALLASGTMGLEMAAAGTPHVSAYRASWLTAAIVRRLVRVDTAHLVNLVLGEKAVPERFQEACTAAALVEAVRPLLDPGPAREAQRAAFARAFERLGRGGPGASAQAAAAVLRGIGG